MEVFSFIIEFEDGVFATIHAKATKGATKKASIMWPGIWLIVTAPWGEIWCTKGGKVWRKVY